ncbi:MAG: type II toxin-antitoxin system VapC family toxin [bacterium]|nr:type II toxin-antitoxin system VapC family toxin [bacterium]
MSRLWVDANVILRFLTGEPQEMYERSVRLMARAERGEVKLVISPIIVAEVIWVLKSFYGNSMAEIAEVIVPFVSAPGLDLEDRETVIQAVELAREKNVDFIDALLALQAGGQDEKVCTFDAKDFKRLPVRWISPPGEDPSRKPRRTPDAGS